MKKIKEELQRSGNLSYEDIPKVIAALKGKDKTEHNLAVEIVEIILAKLKKGPELQ